MEVGFDNAISSLASILQTGADRTEPSGERFDAGRDAQRSSIVHFYPP
jgi:hypothetical protein